MNGGAGAQRAHAFEHGRDELHGQGIDGRMQPELGQLVVDSVDELVQVLARTARWHGGVLGHGILPSNANTKSRITRTVNAKIAPARTLRPDARPAVVRSAREAAELHKHAKFVANSAFFTCTRA